MFCLNEKIGEVWYYFWIILIWKKKENKKLDGFFVCCFNYELFMCLDWVVKVKSLMLLKRNFILYFCELIFFDSWI